MKLRNDVEAIIHLLNNQFTGPYLFLDNGAVINKNDIEHFLVVHAVNTEPWDREVSKYNPPQQRKIYKKKVEKTEEEKYAELEAEQAKAEEEITRDEQSINLDDDGVLHLIAKQRKINCPSTTVLGDANWFICPVYKGMDGLYPLSYTKLSDDKGYRVNVINVPLFKMDPNTLNDENFKDWELNSMFIFNQLFAQNSDNKLGLSTQTVFCHKKIDQLTYFIKKAMDRLKITQKSRIKLGNILVDEVLTYVGQETYKQNKENIANAIKRKKGSNEKANKYESKEVQVIDLIVAAYKRINAVAEKNEKQVPIRRESTFKNMLAQVVDLEEIEHQQDAEEYIKYCQSLKKDPYTPTMEEALIETKTLRASDYISSFITYINTSIYLTTLQTEKDADNMVKRLVHQHYLWKYFEGIKGVAHLSAGAMIADIDFRMTVHPSGVIRYLGLDNVLDVPKREPGEMMPRTDAIRIMRYLFEDYKGITYRIENNRTFGIPKFDEDDQYIWEHFYNSDAIQTIEQYKLIQKVYEWPKLGDNSIDGIFKAFPEFQDLVTFIWNSMNIIEIVTADGTVKPTIKHRARSKKYDKVMTTYLDKNGKINVKWSLGYNAELKSKILHVMFDCMEKHSNPYYIEQVFKPYQERLKRRFEMQGQEVPASKIRIMARRYTIQRFLEDLWMYCRRENGWPTNGGTYYEAKLQGIHRHGLNPTMYK